MTVRTTDPAYGIQFRRRRFPSALGYTVRSWDDPIGTVTRHRGRWVAMADCPPTVRHGRYVGWYVREDHRAVGSGGDYGLPFAQFATRADAADALVAMVLEGRS